MSDSNMQVWGAKYGPRMLAFCVVVFAYSVLASLLKLFGVIGWSWWLTVGIPVAIGFTLVVGLLVAAVVYADRCDEPYAPVKRG